ncbi:sigma-70 family RNA polymerase sigma factor [Candidatus Peregrinibacteria bacterium]|nr:sigma-70 family RNA polymerase sigma factor [Candidatus Peregrinibacteria bacterium]
MPLSPHDREHRNRNIDRLVFLSQTGDSEAFAQLYDLFVVPIYRYVYYRVNNGEAEDLTEMVFMKAWEHLPKYRKLDCTFAAWLFKIARNLVIDYYRMKTSYEELDHTFADQTLYNDPLVQTENTLTQDVLKHALSKLKEIYRQVIVLKFINELSNAEIAQILGRKEGNIRVLQFRALQDLKHVIENEMGLHF